MPGRPERTHLRTRRQLATHNALPQRLPRPKLRRVSRRRPTLHSQSARSLQPERQLARTRTVPGRLHGKPLQRLPPEHSRMSEPTGSHAHPHLQTRRHLETHRRLPRQRPLRRRHGQHLPLQRGLPPSRPSRQPRRRRLHTALMSPERHRLSLFEHRGVHEPTTFHEPTIHVRTDTQAQRQQPPSSRSLMRSDHNPVRVTHDKPRAPQRHEPSATACPATSPSKETPGLKPS